MRQKKKAFFFLNSLLVGLFCLFFFSLKGKASSTFHPQTRKDREGRLWLAWEEWERGGSQIFLQKLGEKQPLSEKICFPKLEGFNHSPYLAFDGNNDLWIAWVNERNLKFRVFLGENRSRKFWLLTPDCLSWASSPRIAFDSESRVWIFWSGSERDKEEIFYRVFDGVEFSPIKSLGHKTRFPKTQLDVCNDREGKIWAVWSGYDGEDYEIYQTLWDGKEWKEEKALTQNSGQSDAFPTLSMILGEMPLLVWVESGERGNFLCARFFMNGDWSEKIIIFSSAEPLFFPRVSIEEERIELSWKSPSRSYRKVINFGELFSENFLPGPASLPVINPLLKENQYICFGDSITYGYMNHEPFPDEGYIPRLEKLMDSAFGDHKLINEGMPGELTHQGLSRISSVLAKHQARYLLLMEGFNDIVFLEISMDTAAFNLKEMVHKSLLYGVFPAIATITPRRDWVWYYKAYRDRIYSLNQKIHQIAIGEAIPLVDQFTAFNNYPEADGGCLSLLSDDLKHPNQKGYQLMAETWFAAVRVFPFSPVDIRVKRRDFVWDTKFSPLGSPIMTPQQLGQTNFIATGLGNFISWRDNPKVMDKSIIKGYNIYRKKGEEPDSQFQKIAFVSGKNSFFDRMVTQSVVYIYILTTVRTDGIEGPCSEASGEN